MADCSEMPTSLCCMDSHKNCASSKYFSSSENVNIIPHPKKATRQSISAAREPMKISSSETDPLTYGTRAWQACFLGHLAVFCAIGPIYSFGIFQTYYSSKLDSTPSEVSWIGSIQLFLSLFLGAISGPLVDAGYVRHVLTLGTFFCVFGLLMVSFATQYWHLILSQGICFGLGSGFLFTPVIALVSIYFDKNRALAIGLTTSGVATGGMAFPAIFREMLPRVGFAWTMRVLTLLELTIMIPIIIWLKPRLSQTKRLKRLDWSVFKETPFILFVLGMFFVQCGAYFAFFYVSISSASLNSLLLIIDRLALLPEILLDSITMNRLI